MIKACDKIIESSFYFLFTLVPLILTPWNYELFEFNKMLLTYFLTILIIGAWLVKMIVSKKIIFRRTPLDIPIFCFLVSQFLSFLVSIDRHTSLFGYYSRFNGGLFSLISYVLLYYAFVSNLDRKKVLVIGHWSLVIAAIIAAYGILEHFGIDADYWVQDVRNRVFSTLGQPNWLAGYLVGLSPLAWSFALKNKKTKKQKNKNGFSVSWFFGFLVAAIFYIALLYTKSRSGLLGFVAADIIFWLLVFTKQKKRILKSFIIYHLSFIILTLAIGTPWTPNIRNFQFSIFNFQKPEETISPIPPVEIPTSVGGTESGEIRKIVWRGAIEIFRHYPLFGTGPETFAYSYYWYRPREHNDVSEWDFLYNKAHNEYLNYLATTGIFGLGSYLFLIAAFLYWNLKELRNQKTEKQKNYWLSTIRHSLLAGYTGLLVVHFFGFSVVTTNLFLFLFPAMTFVLTTNPRGSLPKQPPRLTKGQFVFLALILISSLYALSSILRLWYADFLFSQGKKYLKMNKIEMAMPLIQKATAFNPGEPLFKNELANVASLFQLADFAIEQSNQAVEISPYHLNYWKTRTKMFYNLATINNDYYSLALKSLIHASELAPTDAKVFYNLSALYYYLGEKEKAIKTMEKTVELKPNYEAARKKLEEWRQD